MWKYGKKNKGMAVANMQQSVEERKVVGRMKGRVLIPIIKKGEEEKIKNYRGITLIQTTECTQRFWQRG